MSRYEVDWKSWNARLQERMRLSLGRPSLCQRRNTHRPLCSNDHWVIYSTNKNIAYLSLRRPKVVSQELDPSSMSNISQTVCTIADFPTPGPPLIHIIPFSAQSPLPKIQSITMLCATLRVSMWHFGAGYRACELRSASKATFNSSSASAVPIPIEKKSEASLQTSNLLRTTVPQRPSKKEAKVVKVSIADIVQIVSCDVAIAYHSDGLLGHE